jgi:hypothetical protein
VILENSSLARFWRFVAIGALALLVLESIVYALGLYIGFRFAYLKYAVVLLYTALAYAALPQQGLKRTINIVLLVAVVETLLDRAILMRWNFRQWGDPVYILEMDFVPISIRALIAGFAGVGLAKLREPVANASLQGVSDGSPEDDVQAPTGDTTTKSMDLRTIAVFALSWIARLACTGVSVWLLLTAHEIAQGRGLGWATVDALAIIGVCVGAYALRIRWLILVLLASFTLSLASCGMTYHWG